MSICIRGMEMPHDCDECKLCAFIPVGDYGINRKCLPLSAKAEICIRRSDCPLVSVPPQGDLIDRREAIIDANERAYDFWNCDADVDSTVSFLNEQPTIIPAEEGET